MNSLEPEVDDFFDKNKILQLPFLYIYNHFCQIGMRQLLDKKESLHSFVIPYTFIFEKAKDFSSKTLDACTESVYKISIDDFNDLFACANLNIVLPFVHGGVYKFTRESEQVSFIDYADERALECELNDIVITQLSLPVIPNIERHPKVLIERVAYRLRSKRNINPIFYYDYISDMYSVAGDAIIEADIVPEAFYVHIGFSSADAFRAIRKSLICLAQAYIDICFIVDAYLKVNELYDTVIGKRLWQGLAMAELKAAELKSFVQKLTGVQCSDYDKFAEFFFCDEFNKGNLSNKFMPPFWVIGDKVYFCPAIVPCLLGARNLLISIQNDKNKNKEYKYDNMISCLFEPELLRRAKTQFEASGFLTKTEKKFNGGEVDLLVYCKSSHAVLSVQAKATLYPESARMVRRLDDRIAEAVGQIVCFDTIDENTKAAFFERVFPEIDDIRSANHIRAVLTNSGFGTVSSWQLLKANEIIPINCNMLKNILPCCETLLELPEKIQQHIEELKSGLDVVDSEKVFRLPRQIVYQRHAEIKGMKNLYDEQYWGELAGSGK